MRAPRLTMRLAPAVPANPASPQPRPRWNWPPRRRAAWLVALLPALVLACNTGGDSTGTAADTTVGAATATTTGAGDDGFGEAACAVAGVACESPVDCCASAPPGSGCPNTFPLSFTCEAGTCVQGGCTTQADCADLYTGFSCITVGSKGFCVAACEGDQDCIVDHNMPGTVCIDNAGGDFCREP